MSGALGLAVGVALAQDLPPPAERIQRQADNPLRWIIEAGKLKSRPKAAEAPAPNRAVAARPIVRTAAARPPERAAAASSVASAATPPAVGEAAPNAPADPAPAERPAALPPVALELLEGAEPVLPDDIDAALEVDAVIELAVLVLADGTVADVSTLASSHPAVDEHAIAAVRQWRFKPVPQALVRHVELVFHPRR